MLLEQDIDKIDKFASFFEPREKKVFFELLVIILNKIADDLRRIHNSFRRQILVRFDPPDGFAINKQHAL